MQGEKNTRLRLIIARVYSWNTQKQEGQSNLMQMKLPRGATTLNVPEGNWHEEEFLLWFEHFGIIFKRTCVRRKV